MTPRNQARKSFTVAPSSRFSKSARTGTRVFLNTQAPLTLPGTRSTAAHWAQSSIAKALYEIPQPDKVLQAFFEAVDAPKVSKRNIDTCAANTPPDVV